MPLFRKFSVFLCLYRLFPAFTAGRIEDVERLPFVAVGLAPVLSRASDPTQSSGNRRGAHRAQRGRSGLCRRFYSWYLAYKKDPESAGSLVEAA